MTKSKKLTCLDLGLESKQSFLFQVFVVVFKKQIYSLLVMGWWNTETQLHPHLGSSTFSACCSLSWRRSFSADSPSFSSCRDVT